LARLREPEVSLEATLAWQKWMSADARHAQAFARLEEVSGVLQSIPRPPRPEDYAASADAYDASVPLGDWQKSQRQRSKRPRPWLAVAATLLAATIASMWWSPWSGGGAQWKRVSRVLLQTAVGENRLEKLADGSELTLGGDTEVSASFTDTARRIDLVRGEVFFKVAKDNARPFRVFAGDASVVAVGTEFNVHRRADRVVVAVVEGHVIVEPRGGILPVALMRELRSGYEPVSLKAGQQATADYGGVDTAVPLPDPAAPVAWTTGRLAFRLEPLRYVLEDINRYARKPLVIGDERIAELRITGTVMGDNVDAWATSLEYSLGIEATEEVDRIVLRRTR
jgi:transmembrane sensor